MICLLYTSWYWNGDLAEQAAEEKSGNSSEDSSGTEDISDPFDLYSWDAGTGQYIPCLLYTSHLTVMKGGEHWFHTKEQLAFLNDWMRSVV